MDFLRTMVAVALTVAGTAGTPAPAGPETYVATATIATPGGVTASAPVTIRTLSAAAKVKVVQGAFVVDEYASQALRLTGVRRER